MDRIPLDAISFVGSGLHRPECVLATRAGDLYVSDRRGGVTRIRPDGGQTLYVPAPGAGVALHPNGIALERGGSFLIAHIGDDGGVYRLGRDGSLQAVQTEIDGEPLSAVNFVLLDAQDRIWVTVCTRQRPRHLAYRADVADGYVVLIDGKGARVVCDGIGFTNEVRLTSDGKRLYVVETYARRLACFDVAADGSLSNRRVHATFGEGTFPDGIALDEDGAVWVTSVVSNRLLRVGLDGAVETVIEDADPAHVAWAEAAFQSGSMARPHIDTMPPSTLRSLSSLAFGGPDRRTIYLGCLLGDRLARCASPVAGLTPVHWDW